MFFSLLDLTISLTISWRDSRSSPSPGSSFSCQFLVPSRGAVPCAGCLPLAVSPVTRSSLAVPPALGELGPAFSSSSHTFSSLLGSGASLYGSSSFLSEVVLHCPDFLSSSSSWLVSFGFPSVCTGFLFPLSFCFLCVLGSGAFIFPTTFFPCRIISGGPLFIASLLQVVVLLAGGQASPFFSLSLLPGFPCRSLVWFLIFLPSLLALMASSSSVHSLPSSAGFSHPLVARRLGVPPSRHPSIHLLVGGWSSSMALLLHGLLPPPLHLAIAGSFSISLGLPPLLRWCGSLSYPLLWLSCRSPCLHALLLFGVSCSSLGLLGASFSAHCCLYAVLLPPSSFSAILPPMVYIPTFRCLPSLATVSSVPCAPISFLCMGAWSPCLVSLPCVSFLGFHSSLFPSGRLSMSFFRRSSDSVESPLHYATGSPFGPSQLLVSLLAIHYRSHSSWVSSPFGGPSPRSTSVLRWVFLAFDFLLGSFPFTWAPTCCFLRLLSVPSVCPPLAPFLSLARVSHYFSVFPSWCLGQISVPSRRGPPSGPSLFCRGFRTFFPMVHFLSSSLRVFLICSDSSFHFSVCSLLSASEVFPCSFFPYLSCRLAFLAPLICFCSSF